MKQNCRIKYYFDIFLQTIFLTHELQLSCARLSASQLYRLFLFGSTLNFECNEILNPKILHIHDFVPLSPPEGLTA